MVKGNNDHAGEKAKASVTFASVGAQMAVVAIGTEKTAVSSPPVTGFCVAVDHPSAFCPFCPWTRQRAKVSANCHYACAQ